MARKTFLQLVIAKQERGQEANVIPQLDLYILQHLRCKGREKTGRREGLPGLSGAAMDS